MANLTNVNFYYGAVLAHLFTKNKEYTISLIERSGEQRVFSIETNKHSEDVCHAFCSSSTNEPSCHPKWQFLFSTSSGLAGNLGMDALFDAVFP
ncbi:MAG: hypothetical protein PHY23_00565 [Oscillospiraceae bacterium]|jgi:hypothetical protein|nr:hypothetical protein [Oscillospiraceae bacterium]